ncbi:MAG: ADP-ribosylglycohydrolase family protein [Mycobacteriales bacterium]
MPVPRAAYDSVHGLALGDAFGERWFFVPSTQAGPRIATRRRPDDEARWHWTDDTAMALALLRVVHEHGAVEQDRLAGSFAATYQADRYRGYGPGMHALLGRLEECGEPARWRELAPGLFDGTGSLGNGGAMRVAPVGAWFAGEPDRAAAQAALSAEVTHAHPQGVAGAVAVAVAAALAAGSRGDAVPEPAALLRAVADATPDGPARDGVRAAFDVPGDTPAWRAADQLGNGHRLTAADTVPFALWSAAHHLDDLTEALWTTAAGLGDVDTTCAITGGIVAARTGLAGVPPEWTERREALPDWVEELAG